MIHLTGGISLLICIARSLFKASLLHDYRERAPTSWLQIYRVLTSSPEFTLSLGFLMRFGSRGPRKFLSRIRHRNALTKKAARNGERSISTILRKFIGYCEQSTLTVYKIHPKFTKLHFSTLKDDLC